MFKHEPGCKAAYVHTTNKLTYNNRGAPSCHASPASNILLHLSDVCIHPRRASRAPCLRMLESWWPRSRCCTTAVSPSSSAWFGLGPSLADGKLTTGRWPQSSTIGCMTPANYRAVGLPTRSTGLAEVHAWARLCNQSVKCPAVSARGLDAERRSVWCCLQHRLQHRLHWIITVVRGLGPRCPQPPTHQTHQPSGVKNGARTAGARETESSPAVWLWGGWLYIKAARPLALTPCTQYIPSPGS